MDIEQNQDIHEAQGRGFYYREFFKNILLNLKSV